MDKFVKKAVDLDRINNFINGRDPMERIVNMEYNSMDNFITIYYRDEKDRRCSTKEDFYPFVWATRHACLKLCDGDRQQVSQLLKAYHIKCTALDTTNLEGEHISEYDDGYIFKFQATQPMSYRQFQQFFKDAGNPLYGKKDNKKSKDNTNESKADSRQYLVVTPQEQFMISTGKRYFKGYDDYDELLRLIFDLETGGLNPEVDRIESVGIRFNRKPQNYELKDTDEEGTFNRTFKLEGTTESEKNASELGLIKIMLSIIYTFKPDVITAHNGENFDWNFIIVRCTQLGTSIEELSEEYFNGRCIKKNQKETILKLGGEIETFYQTIVPQTVVTDSLHAVRRAQALDSNMLRADLKYVTKYSKMKKVNRVYVPGNKISEISNDLTLSYAFNDLDGDWYKVTENKPKKEGYRLVTGEYIVDRYLYDDLWECDKVELRYNLPNFLICKMLPVPFQKCCTMGTAGQWKAMLLAWCFENNLAVPMFGESKTFTGGLSRLLSVGYVDRVAKFDYNSLYPSIILTWDISDKKDLTKIMLHLLEYVLTQREKYKKLKKIAGKEKDKYKAMLENFTGTPDEKRHIEDELRKYASEESLNDKKQLPLKILANSFFGSYGAPNVFPFGSIVCAERTTCTGRMSLRLMISHFNNLGYRPIVGDSFTPDTPLFIRWKDSGMIDIVPVETLINPFAIKVDELGREYDYSKKPFEVLCRSGWVSPEYIYRHKCDKPIYEVSEGEMKVEVTEDHSLFNSKQVKIKPSQINSDTKLEYYNGEIEGLNQKHFPYDDWKQIGIDTANRPNGKINIAVFNTTKENMKLFYDSFMKNYKEGVKYSKTIVAGLQYIKKTLNK